MRSAILLAIWVFLASGVVHAQIYKCEQGGRLVFSDRPCGDDAEVIEQRTATQVGGSLANPAAEGFLQHRATKETVERIDRQIADLERRKSNVRQMMDRDLAEWQRNRARANNNLAGATWEQSLAQEAEVKRARHQSEIDQIDREIDRLRDDRREALRN